MNYYEQIFELKEFPGYFFKITRIKPTKIYAMTMTFGKVMNPKAPADPDALEKVGDFIVETLLFSKSKNGPFEAVKKPGLESYEFVELETNPMALLVLSNFYFNNVIHPAENI